MSVTGTKRTTRIATLLSAFDPLRTLGRARTHLEIYMFTICIPDSG
jgi:hypothetical protein